MDQDELEFKKQAMDCVSADFPIPHPHNLILIRGS